MPILIAEADKQVNADLYAKPLGELVSGASPKSLYKFEVSPDAAKVPITGDFEDALCDADLLLQICNKLPGNSSAAQTRRPEPFTSARKRIQSRARLSSVGRVLRTGG